jgi:ribonuclease I
MLFDATSFDHSTVQMTWELQQEMLANWVSFTCPKPKPEGLWKHEWKKHGSCSGMDRLTYFQTAMTLRNVYNILEMFHVEGMLQLP